MSRTHFTPALTTVIGVTARVGRSADSSKVSLAPRCTPPRPPVAKTRMPASAARCAVAATVVAPLPPRAARIGRSRTLALASSSSAMRRTPSASSPMWGTPSSTATVAGVTPAIAQDLLELARGLVISRPRKAVGDDRGLEGDDGRFSARAAATASETINGVLIRQA